MNEAQSAVPGSVVEGDSNAVDLLGVMVGLARHKKAMIVLPIVGAIIAAAIGLVMPNTYRAGTVLLPPQHSQSGASALLAQLGGAGGVAAGVAGLKSPNDLYVGMLKSRVIADKLIVKFDLKKVYDTDSTENARKELARNTAILSGKEGLITIDVEDGGQQLVAKLANAYAVELLQLTGQLAVTEASKRRVFFERQLEMAKNNLTKAEVGLKGSLEAGGVASVDGESRGVVETVVRLRARISAKVIELDAMRAVVTSSHPSYKLVAEEISSLRAELARLQNGSGIVAPDSLAVGAGGLANVQRLRDLKYYQMLYELLVKQYEVARLDEAKDPGLVQVLDVANVPERHVTPKRLLLTVVGAFAGLFIAMLYAFFSETKKRALSRPGAAAKWAELQFLMGGKRRR